MVRAVMVLGVLFAAPAIASAQQQRCTTDANQVVQRVYQQILERPADANASGRAQALAQGRSTVRDIVADMAKSQEHNDRFLQPNDTPARMQTAVNFVYKHLLGRQADANGLQNYTQRAQRAGFNAVVDEILSSPEYMDWYGADGVPGTSVRWCGSGTTVAAAPAPAAQPPMRFRGMDANGDGQIQRTEWRGSVQSFRVHDWNQDGVLAGDEVRPGGQRQAGGWADRDFDTNTWSEADFTELDANRDNRITSAEWYFDAQDFRRADRNRDGVLTRAEYLGTNIADDDRGDRFEFLDENGNGRVERAEWHGSRDPFEWLDRNNDGLLTRAEVVGNEASVPDGFTNIDDNNDGRIQVSEWRWSRRSFNGYDTNGDGIITRREFRGSAVPTTGR